MRVPALLGTLALLLTMLVAGCDEDGSVPGDAGDDADAPSDADADADAAEDVDAGVEPDAQPIHGDTCADPVDLNGESTPVDGVHRVTTSLATYVDDYDTCDEFLTDGDVVYVYTPGSAGTLRVYVSSDAAKRFAVRSDCEEPTSALTQGETCAFADTAGCAGGDCGFRWEVSGGEPVYVLVDGAGDVPRTFTLTVELVPYLTEGGECDAGDWRKTCGAALTCRVEGETAAACREIVCGDGLIEGEEECDDDNADAGDGCSDACALEDQGPGGETCAAATDVVLVPIGGPYLRARAAGDSSSATGNLEGACATSTTSPDDVFSFALDAASSVQVNVVAESASWHPVVYVREASGATCGATESGCATDAELAGTASLPLSSLDAGTYYVVVDGDDANAPSSGTYTLELLAALL